MLLHLHYVGEGHRCPVEDDGFSEQDSELCDKCAEMEEG